MAFLANQPGRLKMKFNTGEIVDDKTLYKTLSVSGVKTEPLQETEAPQKYATFAEAFIVLVPYDIEAVSIESSTVVEL
jgi:hypothetical protein